MDFLFAFFFAQNGVYLLFFCTRPSLGLLPVLVPLGSGTDTTHQPGPALRLLGCLVITGRTSYTSPVSFF